MTLDPQFTGNAGLYYCCYHLSLLRWNVMPTARNARGVDIIAYSQDATRKLAIQPAVGCGEVRTASIEETTPIQSESLNRVPSRRDGVANWFLMPALA